MAYSTLGWVNGQEPAINASNLNHMDQGIADAEAAATAAATLAGASAPVVVEMGGGNINGKTSTALYAAFQSAKLQKKALLLISADDLCYDDDPLIVHVGSNGIGNQYIPFVKQTVNYQDRFYFSLSYFPSDGNSETASLYIAPGGKITAIPAQILQGKIAAQ